MKNLRLYGAGLLVALLLALAACGTSGGGSGGGGGGGDGGGGGGGGGSPDFTISLSPDSLTVQQGLSGTTQLTITPQGGFTGTVSLSGGRSQRRDPFAHQRERGRVQPRDPEPDRQRG